MSSKHQADESQSLLQELMVTPVGRRWLLKAGLGSRGGGAGPAPPPGGAPAAATGQKRQQAQPVTSTTMMQFALGSVTGVSGLTLFANGARYPLTAHTAASRQALRADGGLWAIMDLSALTHYVPDVPLPTGRGIMLSVRGHRDNSEVVACQVFHAPPQATLALAAAALTATRSLSSVLGSPQRLAALGIEAAAVTTPAEVVQLDTVGDSYQTAIAMTMCHPNVATVDPTATATTKALLGQTPAVQTLGTTIGQMQRQGRDFATLVQATDADGAPAQIKVGSTTTTFSTMRLNSDDATFTAATKSAVFSGIRAVRDDASLGAVIDTSLAEDPAASKKTWVQPQGVVPVPQPYAPHLADSALDIKIKNEGFYFGTRTVANGSYADGKLPLKIYNNFVRYVSVYVQYLGAGDKVVPPTGTHNALDTKYSKFLALLPQVFTIVGIPVWDSNTIEVELEFPEGAHSARLLYCGLGADALGNGWRQYFPDDAYKNQIAPSGEVTFPSVMTGVLTIGLTVFALVLDINVSVIYKEINELVGVSFGEWVNAVFEAVDNEAGYTALEVFVTSVLKGGATYEEIAANGGNADNLWTLLLELGSLIPKVIFNPKASLVWEKVGEYILGEETTEKVLDALPVIGQFLSILSAVGDAVTLAEVAAETIVSPWVIENEASLTYQATVTISRDPRAATFPVTARSWRLEAKIDGVSALTPVTGTVNEGGKTRSDPLALTVTAPFGGADIQWTFVLLDAAGNQVGTGVSAPLTNDDPGHPPTTVAFAITQLPATITASTVFKRADTTTYSTAADGYTWSDQVTDTGTINSTGIQEVTGAAVATLAGVAGMVWKQGDHYYLRGVPVAQNGATFKLGSASKQGYARRPFLLLDAFVKPGDQGNHVLLEPDDTNASYQVRKVTPDSATGALTWDSSVSYGTFTLPVSAAALHSSGTVIALHTDSGRVGFIQPAVTSRPQLAAYNAGPGTQTGLLQSPIAVAVTNPGTVLVLEAGASQLSAFDLNGNPARYFGTGSPKDFTLALVSKGTYLDVAVDGANQVYLLYYTGDGSAPADYHVDVYTETGAVLDTKSPGVNVPHLAVDYWRSIFGANFDPLTNLGTTTPHIDPVLKVAEPSLSRFDPTTASAGTAGVSP
jgi:hypothetical protein